MLKIKKVVFTLVTQIHLPCSKNYSYERTSARLRSSYESMYHEEKGLLYRAMQGERNPLFLFFSFDQTVPSLKVTVTGQLAIGEKERLTHRLTRMWSTEKDLSSFEQQFVDDPYLSQVIKERAGLHWVLDPTLYECLISTIISQQLNLAFAATLKRRLLTLIGETITSQGMTLPIFPQPDQIAQLAVNDLMELQFSKRKAEYVIDLSRKVAEGQLDLGSLERQSNTEVMQRLLPLRGIGKWTIACLLLFGLGREDVLPAADIGLRNAVQKVYALQERPSEEDIIIRGRSWSPFQSYVTFYLWDKLSTK